VANLLCNIKMLWLACRLVDCFVVADMGLCYGQSMTTVNSVMDYNNYECWPIYVHTMANIDQWYMLYGNNVLACHI
jgi:hypothetical protein